MKLLCVDASPSKFLKHMETYTLHSSISCPRCGVVGFRLVEIDRYEDSKHEKSYFTECNKCGGYIYIESDREAYKTERFANITIEEHELEEALENSGELVLIER